MEKKLGAKYTSNKNNNNIKKMSGKEYIFSIMSAFHVMYAYMQKTKVRCQSIKRILGIKKYLNLIGQEHFQPCSSMLPHN